MRKSYESDHDKPKPKEALNSVRGRILRFGSAGAASSVLYYVLAAGITRYMPGHEMLASTTAYSACIGFSFILQRNFAFRSAGNIRFELVRFITVSVLGLLLSTLIVYVAVFQYGLSPYISYAIVIATIPLLSYILFNRFVFS